MKNINCIVCNKNMEKEPSNDPEVQIYVCNKCCSRKLFECNKEIINCYNIHYKNRYYFLIIINYTSKHISATTVVEGESLSKKSNELFKDWQKNHNIELLNKLMTSALNKGILL